MLFSHLHFAFRSFQHSSRGNANSNLIQIRKIPSRSEGERDTGIESRAHTGDAERQADDTTHPREKSVHEYKNNRVIENKGRAHAQRNCIPHDGANQAGQLPHDGDVYLHHTYEEIIGWME